MTRHLDDFLDICSILFFIWYRTRWPWRLQSPCQWRWSLCWGWYNVQRRNKWSAIPVQARTITDIYGSKTLIIHSTIGKCFPIKLGSCTLNLDHYLRCIVAFTGYFNKAEFPIFKNETYSSPRRYLKTFQSAQISALLSKFQRGFKSR